MGEAKGRMQFAAAQNEDGSQRVDFPFVEFGAGVGMIQGTIMGMEAGLILVAIAAWHGVRTSTATSGALIPTRPHQNA
jgi:hypothetical protein